MALSISSPVDGDDLTSSTCYASGTSDPDQALYGTLGQPGGQPVLGMLVSMPPNWVLQFQNVPVGSNYTLTVQDFDNPPSTGVVQNLTVVVG